MPANTPLKAKQKSRLALDKGTFTVLVMFVMFAAGGRVLTGDELPDWVGFMMAFGPIAFWIIHSVLPEGE